MTKFFISFLQACGIVFMLCLVMCIVSVVAMAAGIISAFAWLIGFSVMVITGFISFLIFMDTK